MVESPTKRALAILSDAAEEAADTLIGVMRDPPRNAQSKLAAARAVLDLAGVSLEEADKRHEELLTALRAKISEAAYAEVVRALAGMAQVARSGEQSHCKSSGGEVH